MPTQKQTLKLLLIAILFVMVFLVSPASAQAAALTQVSATPSNVTQGATVGYTVNFKTVAAVPKDGKISVQFLAGFTVSGATFTSFGLALMVENL
jgi:hypothetical protein